MSNESKPVVYFCTGNRNKFVEAQRILSTLEDVPFELCMRDDIELLEIQSSLTEVAKHKVTQAAEALKGENVIVEDSALEFRAMNPMPGVYIKHFLEAVLPEGLCRILDGFADRRADAMCMLAYRSGSSGAMALFLGQHFGEIPSFPVGDGGFGWDSVFRSETGQTYAEMQPLEKDKISDRAEAWTKFVDYFKENKLNLKLKRQE